MNVPISISSIGQDEVGNLYVTSFDDGVLYQLYERPDSSENGEVARENIALRGSGRASSQSGSIPLATDGDPATGWEAEHAPPQWFSVLLDDLYLIDQVELVFPQNASGPAILELWLGNGSGTRALFKRFNHVRPDSDSLLTIPLDPPQIANEVMLLSLQSQDDVAWQEVRVFGSSAGYLHAESPVPQVRLAATVSGLELPVLITHAGDGSGRVFVAEQKGRIRVLKEGRLLDSPFSTFLTKSPAVGSKACSASPSRHPIPIAGTSTSATQISTAIPSSAASRPLTTPTEQTATPRKSS